LVRAFSYELQPGWWLGINLSRKAVERIAEMACEVAGLRYGVDLKVKVGALERTMAWKVVKPLANR